MTVDVQIGTKADGIILTDAAAVKVKNLLDQEGRDDLSLRVQVSRVAAPACATSCSSTTGRWTATWSASSAASRS